MYASRFLEIVLLGEQIDCWKAVDISLSKFFSQNNKTDQLQAIPMLKRQLTSANLNLPVHLHGRLIYRNTASYLSIASLLLLLEFSLGQLILDGLRQDLSR